MSLDLKYSKGIYYHNWAKQRGTEIIVLRVIVLMCIDLLCYVFVGKVSGLVEEVTKAHQDIESKQAVVKELQAERDKLKVEKERAQHQLNQRTRQAPGRNVLKVLTKQGAQYQFSQGTRQDANCHIRIQESKVWPMSFVEIDQKGEGKRYTCVIEMCTQGFKALMIFLYFCFQEIHSFDRINLFHRIYIL